ncbi:hypothetical protein ACIQUM_07655 [Amycolatopsis azurea]|uniref:hypothetical protein n=1 Tax=Amycolatopsis azurea TaxID=36819 RepID=UPI0037F1123D
MTIARSRQQNWGIAVVADDARRTLATNVRDADELRDLGLMLGLFVADPDGSVGTANPLAADVCLSRTARTAGASR